MLTVGVLGPLDVSVSGRAVELTSPTLRTVLVVLAMAGGAPVPVERLAAALWDDELPEHLRRAVQTHLTRLRAALGPGYVVTHPGGYALQVDPERVDALRFARLLDRATAGDQRRNLEEALALWRGTPFDDARSRWLDGLRNRLVEQYLAAVERRVDLDLAAGRHHAVVGELRELIDAHPVRETLWVRLLTALAGSGRPAEALSAYETIRQRLADALGADPGPELRRIHAALLDGPPAEPVPAVPRQLPPDIPGFTGRAAELKTLHTLVDPSDAVMIAAVSGMAGVGKTALAVHWAHEVADRFPDGQLYVDLRGFHPSGQAVAPAEALRTLLDALSVPAARIPGDPDGRAGLYRTLLADRRMLVVLDNARDADQVRPLIPGSPACVVLVTSRNRLTGLTATGAARPVVLDVLPDAESRDLLAARLGTDRVAAEPSATHAVVARCGGLPLALAVIAARVLTDPAPLRDVADQLAAEESTLDSLAAGDPATDARVVFSWSYRALSDDAARLFRLLSLHPGPDVATDAVASLAGVDHRGVRRSLRELLGAHLLTERAPGRYAMHDLLRAYATELTGAHDDGADRHAALHRLFDHYLHTAYAAAGHINPGRDPLALAGPLPGTRPGPIADHLQAMAWFIAEYRVLLLVIGHAVTHGFDGHAWRLARSVTDFLHRRGHWPEWLETQRVALAAARRAGDRQGQALAHRGIAVASSNLGHHDEAEPHYRRDLDLHVELDDPIGQAKAHLNLSASLDRRGRHAEALAHCEQALAVHLALDDRVGEAKVRNSMGMLHAQLGNHAEALASCERAIVLYRDLGDRHGLAHTWDSLGFAHHRRGSLADAVDCYRRSAALFEEIDNTFLLARTLTNLGDAHRAAGEPAQARAAWQRALDLLAESGHPRADEVRDRLARLG